MPKVIARPTALLDGSKEAGELVPKGSDAERYSQGSRPFSVTLRDLLPLRSRPDQPLTDEEIAKTRANRNSFPIVDRRFVTYAIGGEDNSVYGFDDRGEPREDDGDIAEGPLRVMRFTGEQRDTAQVLGFVGLNPSEEPVFYSPDPSDRLVIGERIEDPAQQSELTQIVAAGTDSLEWATH